MPVLLPQVFVVVLRLHIITGDFICAMCVLCVCVYVHSAVYTHSDTCMPV